MADRWPEALANALRFYRDVGVGAGDVAGALGSGMLAQVPAGLAGAGTFIKEALTPDRTGRARSLRDAAGKGARTVRSVEDALTYQPRSDIGRRGVENVGKGIEWAGDQLLRAPGAQQAQRGWEGFTAAAPAAAAGIVGLANVVGPKGKPKQLDLPEVPQARLSAADRLAQAEQALQRTKSEASRLHTGSGSGNPEHTGWDWELHAEAPGNPPYYRADSVTHHDAFNVPADYPPSAIGIGARPEFREDVMRAQETLQTILRQRAERDALRGPAELETAREEAARARAQIAALRAKPEPDGLRAISERERQIVGLKREMPILTDAGVYRYRGGIGMVDPQGQSVPHDSPALPPEAAEQLAAIRNQGLRYSQARRMSDEYDEFFLPEDPPPQPAWVERLNRENPGRESSLMSRDHPADAEWWHRALPDPSKANAEAFLEGARQNPALFEFGLAPTGRNLDDIAAEYGERTGKRIDIDYESGDSDEPYKIKTEKTHGRGEMMRDRYGEYKTEDKLHERGNYPMYDEQGEVKKVEVKGPPEEGEDAVYAKRIAEGGELKRDRYGDPKYAYVKSEGGELKRDERGRVKYQEEENPDYSEPSDKITLRVGRDNIEYTPGEGVYAVNAGKHGKLLYQVLNSYALGAGEDIPSSSLTKDNQLRLLGNTLSTYARHGENPRDVSGTSSGDRPRARGQAGGFEMWNAEAGETERRVRSMGGDPERLQFTGEGFAIDGRRASARDVKAQLDELSPGWDETKVGPQTLMRMAVLRYLESATPQMARELAQDWPKELGSLFAGVSALSVGAGLMREEQTQ